LDTFNGSHDDLVAFAHGDHPPACGTIAATGGEIDDGDSCFAAGGPAQYLRHVADAGEQGDLVWTHATAAAAEANFATWQLVFAAVRLVPVDDTTPPPPPGQHGGGCAAGGGDAGLLVALLLVRRRRPQVGGQFRARARARARARSSVEHALVGTGPRSGSGSG